MPEFSEKLQSNYYITKGQRMKIVKAISNKQLSDIRNLYLSAFPDAEQKPFSMIKKLCNMGKSEMLCLESDNGDFLGLAITVLYEDLVLLDYFAISPEGRGKGTGSNALQILKEKYAGKRFFLEIESTLDPQNCPEERTRRKSFYLRGGMSVMPFEVDLFGVKMEILTNGCTVTYEDYHNLYRSILPLPMLCKVKLLRSL